VEKYCSTTEAPYKKNAHVVFRASFSLLIWITSDITSVSPIVLAIGNPIFYLQNRLF